MMDNQVLPWHNIVYRGTCYYASNWWNEYEMVQGWIFYDKDEGFYVRVKHGKKFADIEGSIALMRYDNWEDVLKDWWVPRIVKADPWADGEAPPKNFEGNTNLDVISGVRQSFIEGWRGEEKGAQSV